VINMSRAGKKWILKYPRIKFAAKLSFEIAFSTLNKRRPFTWIDVYDWDLFWNFYYAAHLLDDKFSIEELSYPDSYGKSQNTLKQHFHYVKSNSTAIKKVYDILLKEKVEEGLLFKGQFQDHSRTRRYRTPKGALIEDGMKFYNFKEFPGFPKKSRIYRDLTLICILCGEQMAGHVKAKKYCDKCK